MSFSNCIICKNERSNLDQNDFVRDDSIGIAIRDENGMPFCFVCKTCTDRNDTPYPLSQDEEWTTLWNYTFERSYGQLHRAYILCINMFHIKLDVSSFYRGDFEEFFLCELEFLPNRNLESLA